MCRRMEEFALLKFVSGLCCCKSCAILGTRYRSKTTICGFSRNRFLVLKKALLTSLLAERNLQSEMRKAKKQKRIDDMTCPPSLMTRSQVFNECKLRLNESEASIRPRLTSYASILKFTDSEAEKLLLPTLRSILQDLREKPVEGGADGVMH